MDRRKWNYQMFNQKTPKTTEDKEWTENNGKQNSNKQQIVIQLC